MTGVAATLFHAAVFSTSDVPLVGASGAISGVLGFYFVWFPQQHRPGARLPAAVPDAGLLDPGPLRPRRLPVPRQHRALPLRRGGWGGPRGAHRRLPGRGAGGVGDGSPRRRRPGRGTSEGPEGRARSAGRRSARPWPRAATSRPPRTTSPFPRRRPAERSRRRRRWRSRAGCADNGHVDAALVLLRRVVRDTPRGPGLAEVYALAGFILLEDKGEATAAYQYLLTALELGPEAGDGRRRPPRAGGHRGPAAAAPGAVHAPRAERACFGLGRCSDDGGRPPLVALSRPGGAGRPPGRRGSRVDARLLALPGPGHVEDGDLPWSRAHSREPRRVGGRREIQDEEGRPVLAGQGQRSARFPRSGGRG